jgi:Transcriptional regulator
VNTPSSTGIPNFRQIRSFLALAKHLSFTRAAEELGISQPTLTVQIHQLEEILSVVLFDRNRRQVRLTEVGKNLLQPLEQLLTDLEAVLNFSSDHAQLKSGTIRIACLPSVAASLLPKAIRAFNQQYPGINIQIYDIDAEAIIEMVKLEQVDFGVGMTLLPDRDITIDSFLSDYLCVYYPEGHPLQIKKHRKIRLKDCAQYPLILTSRNGSIRKVLEHALMDEEIEINIASEANYMSTALAMVRENLGITILPASATLNGSMEGIDFAPIDSPHLHREIGITRKQSKRLSPAAESFLLTLKHEAEQDRLFNESILASSEYQKRSA